MRKNKTHSVHDFIIFLKAKIAIIIIVTGLFSSIAVYNQIDYVDYWKINISRTIDRAEALEALSYLKKSTQKDKYEIEKIRSMLFSIQTEYGKTGEYNNNVINYINSSINYIDQWLTQKASVTNIVKSPVNFFWEMNKFVNSLLVNFLSNQNIKYEGILDKEEDVFKKQNYKLILTSTNINEDMLKKKLNIFFEEVIEETLQMIRMQNNLNENYKFQIYDFNIENIQRVEGYNYLKIIKIISLIFFSSIFFIYIFHIRKIIKIF